MPCRRCGTPVTGLEPWDLGHVIALAAGGTMADGVGPEHRTCSRKAGGIARWHPETLSLGPSRQW